MPLTRKDVRATLLSIVTEQARARSGSPLSGGMQQVSILAEAKQRLGGRLSFDEEQALLTAWYDLFRNGHLAWGYNLNNPDPPFCHVTDQGRRALAQISRDPSNPDGYVAHLTATTQLNPIATSYIEEALETYNANCFRATAVMVGGASESVALEVRDAVVAGIQVTGRTAPKGLNDFRIKQVLDALQKEFEMQQAGMPNDLREQVEAYWPAFIQQIRSARNEAGHPSSIEPVTPEAVHAALLIFPELATLAQKLKAWAATHYN